MDRAHAASQPVRDGSAHPARRRLGPAPSSDNLLYVRPLLALQGVAGNQATAELIRSRRLPPLLQRFDTGEHAQMGTDDVMVINGVSFTRAQLVAMGDFYQDYDQMKSAPRAELERLKRDIIAQTRYYKKEPGGRDVPEGKGGWDEDTGGRYLKLAAANDTHFARPASTAAETTTSPCGNKTISVRCEPRAPQGFTAGLNEAVPDEAYAINAFGNHFLTDAIRGRPSDRQSGHHG